MLGNVVEISESYKYVFMSMHLVFCSMLCEVPLAVNSFVGPHTSLRH